MQVIVLKFGGSSVSDVASFDNVAQIIADKSAAYDGCVVVISAMRGMTDRLINLAYQVHPNPPQREYDMLISVGERISISLLAMALDRHGVKAVSLTGSQSGIITSSEHSFAKIANVRPERIWEHLNQGQVVIVAGFQGVCFEKNITTLGRGGSDTSAVALAVSLNAETVEFYKDVDGVYDCDPNENPQATLLSQLDHQEAFDLMQTKKPILHPRSIALAKKNNLPMSVLSFKNKSGLGTVIGCTSAQRAPEKIYETN